MEPCSDPIKIIIQLKILELGIFQKIKIIIRQQKFKIHLKQNKGKCLNDEDILSIDKNLSLYYLISNIF